MLQTSKWICLNVFFYNNALCGLCNVYFDFLIYEHKSTYVSASIFKACGKSVVVVVVVITCTIIECASITIVICLSSGKEMIDIQLRELRDIQWMRRIVNAECKEGERRLGIETDELTGRERWMKLMDRDRRIKMKWRIEKDGYRKMNTEIRME